MIDAVTIEGFRGLRRLEVEGFGRVNLIIGKNDSGKTTLMEAVLAAHLGEDGAHLLTARQAGRGLLMDDIVDIERFWLPRSIRQLSS